MSDLDSAPDTGAQAHSASLAGLRVKLLPCRACGCITATIGKASMMVCESCGRKRGRVDPEVRKFLHNFIETFGRPTAPFEIRGGS